LKKYGFPIQVLEMPEQQIIKENLRLSGINREDLSK
jgi:hypothetical protein